LENGALGCKESQKALKMKHRECLDTLHNIHNIHDLTWNKCIKALLDRYIQQ